jgi:nascent polypeptide-associated complex subunit alpha
MFPGINPKKMQAMMKQMGIAQDEIPAEKVIIETQDKNIVINNPSVTKINMQGNETFQIAGDVEEQEKEDFSEQDIQTIVEKTNCTPEQAKAELEKTGDIAEAIINLS